MSAAYTEAAPSIPRFTAIQGIKSKKDLPGLAPKGCLISAEAVDRVIGHIGESQKAKREFAAGMHSRFDGYVSESACAAVRFWIRVDTSRVGPSEQGTNNLLRAWGNLAGLVEPTRLACLAFEQAGFNSCRAAQAPQKAGQSQYEFPLYGRLGIVVGDAASNAL